MADLQTYVPIQSTILSSSSSSVSFSSIPNTYTDLYVVVSLRTNTGGATEYRLSTNLSGSIYTSTFLDGYGTGATSFRDASSTSFRPGFIPGSTQGFSTNNFSFINYANTTTNKTVIGRYGSSDNEVLAFSTLIANSGAINSLTFTSSNGFGIGSTFAIYGIKAA